MISDNVGFKKQRVLPGSTFPCAWSADGSIIFSAMKTGGLVAWDAESGRSLWHIDLPVGPYDEDERGDTFSGSFAAFGEMLAVCISDEVNILSIRSAEPIASWKLPEDVELGKRWIQANIAWSPDGLQLAVTADGRVLIYDIENKLLVRVLTYPKEINPPVTVQSIWSKTGHVISASYHAQVWNDNGSYDGRYESTSGLYDVTLCPANNPRYLVGGSSDRKVLVWDVNTRQLTTILEGHTSEVRRVSYDSENGFLFSASRGELKAWSVDDWKPVGSMKIGNPDHFSRCPGRPAVAVSSARRTIQIWSYDPDILREAAEQSDAVTYTSAKIVLVGDSGVGKTGLGWRLAHGSFKDHSSTHGQQFWLLDDASTKRLDGTQCEAVLWDLAGQPDYRLVHALFLDDADAALLVFDPTHAHGPVQGTQFWIRQLNLRSASNVEGRYLPSVLIAARCDRGMPQVSRQELSDYATNSGLDDVIYTSAASGEGLADLQTWLKGAIDWNKKPSTVTTLLFKRIKNYVLSLKESSTNRQAIYTFAEIYRMFRGSSDGTVDRDKVETALLHLSNHGYVALLRGSTGERRVLLVPELLNNLAASVVLEARRNARGLGSVDEVHLMDGGYHLEELKNLNESDREAMIDSVVTMLLQHNVCFREIDPLNKSSYIVFPELINSRKPINAENDVTIEDSSYTISGSVENVYASLVVLMGYTSTFTRTAQWRAHARYEVGDGLVCGFRLAEDRGGEQDFVLYYGEGVGGSVKNIFKGLFEAFLSRHDIKIRRFDPVACSKGHRLNRVLLRELTAQGLASAHCPICASPISIPDTLTPTNLSEPDAMNAKQQVKVADLRHRLEDALYRLKSLVNEAGTPAPSVFISYAWGDSKHERWVEKNLARDLFVAGIDVILDRWENSTVGASIPRFVEKIHKADKVLVVGTPLYRLKYLNEGESGTVVAAEGDLLAFRMIGTESAKRSVLPILVDGTAATSFPDIIQGRVYASFKDALSYENSIIDLIASIYELNPKHERLAEIRESLASSFA